MKSAASIFVFIIAAGVTILYLLYANEQKLAEATAENTPILICGTTAPSELEEVQKQGEKLFKMNCAACHKLDQHATGPALRGVKARFEEEKNQSVDAFFELRKTQYEAIMESRERLCLISPKITTEDLKKVLQYASSPK
jgi:cytochrome c551/c552